jgi:DNA invertase Pin-like site-specific DNA recombinase
MMPTTINKIAANKIAAHHQDRRAYVYVRQSTPKQVLQHRESQVNQYALVERAIALGWAPSQVHVIDADLGQSGQDGQRAGFQELVAEVSLGRVGIILAYEASRLARNNADWYALLDLATVVDTLIADADGLYDPRQYNDRLLLGLRGMFSEAELHLLRLRLEAGRLRQVERGSFRHHLPTGLVRLPDGRVRKDPDRQVQHAIALVFARFAALGSCQQVLRSLRADAILLPRRQLGGLHAGELLWRQPSYTAIYEILRNPAYAGAFVYGRTGTQPSYRPGHPPQRHKRPLPEWTAIHQDAYPAYISWEQFMANRAQIADNASRLTPGTRGAPRQGSALLVGLVTCGRCGRRMRVAYRTHGPHARYHCRQLKHEYGEPTCQNLSVAHIDQAVVAAFFEAIAPAELALLDEVLAAQRAARAQLTQQHADQVQRAEYEARLAERQYRAVDPEHRLVAVELERRWELALQALRDGRAAAERFAQTAAEPELAPELRAQLQDLSQALPALWTSGQLRPAQQKALLRSLIRRVVLIRPRPDTVAVRIVWISGAVSPLEVHPRINRARDVADYERLVERIVALSREGHPDREIARQLTAEGFRSARTAQVPYRLVVRVRTAQGIPSLTEQLKRGDKFAGQWTIGGLARALGVDRNWIYYRIQQGRLPAQRHPVTGHYLIRDDPRLLDQLRPQPTPCDAT